MRNSNKHINSEISVRPHFHVLCSSLPFDVFKDSLWRDRQKMEVKMWALFSSEDWQQISSCLSFKALYPSNTPQKTIWLVTHVIVPSWNTPMNILLYNNGNLVCWQEIKPFKDVDMSRCNKSYKANNTISLSPVSKQTRILLLSAVIASSAGIIDVLLQSKPFQMQWLTLQLEWMLTQKLNIEQGQVLTILKYSGVCLTRLLFSKQMGAVWLRFSADYISEDVKWTGHVWERKICFLFFLFIFFLEQCVSNVSQIRVWLSNWRHLF